MFNKKEFSLQEKTWFVITTAIVSIVLIVSIPIFTRPLAHGCLNLD